MNYTFLVAICDLQAWHLLLGLLLPFLLGYLVRRFIDQDKRERLVKVESEYNSLQGEISKNAQYKTNFHTAEGDNKKLQLTIANNEKEIIRLKAEATETTKKYKAFAGIDVSALQSKIASLETSNNSLQNSIAAMNNTVVENTNEEPSVSIEELQANANKMKERFTYIESENARLKIDLKSAIAAKDSIVRSEENLVKYKEEVREMSGRIGGYTVESDRLKKEIAEAKAFAKAATDELTDLKAKISGSQNNNEKAAVEANELQTKINALQNELTVVKASANDSAKLANELKEAKEKLAASEINLSSAKLKVEQAAAIVPVTVEKIVEKRVEVPVEKIVEKVIEKTVEVSSPADKQRIAELEAALANVKATPAPIAVAPVATKPDDLEVVEGIGPKVNELFKAKGVTTYAQLAAMSKEEVAGVLESGGSRFQILNGNSWPKQAELLRDGKTEEFQAYTDYLIAGVDPKEVKSAAADVTPDDLKVIEGIGPKIEGLLNADGIYTFAELANSTYDRLKTILDNAGSRYQMHDPTSWPTQSVLARDGKTEELQKMQDELKGGKA